MNKLLTLALPACLLLLLFSACRKFDQVIERKNGESGIVNIIPAVSDLGKAKTEEEIIVHARIGEVVKSLEFYVGDVPMTIKSSEEIMDSVEDVFLDVNIGLPMTRYKMDIPKNAKIGPNQVYFVINGKRRPPMQLYVVKPDILFPGKVTVYPYANPYLQTVLKDGPIGEASMANIEGLTYDAAGKTFYFTDWYYENPGQEGSPWYSVIRSIKDSIVTTIAGGGSNLDATNGRDLKVGTITAMCAGTDGRLYLATEDQGYPTNPGGSILMPRTRIISIDPHSGEIIHVAGAKKRNGNFWQGFKDGKEDATMTRITSMSFDKTGNLWFIDDVGLLRKVAPDGTVTTVLGQVAGLEYETVDWETGEPIMETVYEITRGHTDGFGSEVQLMQPARVAVAGNGKIYIEEQEAGGWQANIRVYNPDTKEMSTIVGLPGGVRTFVNTGTFKEVELGQIYSFDVDFDGNIIYSAEPPFALKPNIYKMDLQSETIALIAGRQDCIGDGTKPIPGSDACFFGINRIVFDHFGSLYVSSTSNIRRITIEKN